MLRSLQGYRIGHTVVQNASSSSTCKQVVVSKHVQCSSLRRSVPFTGRVRRTVGNMRPHASEDGRENASEVDSENDAEEDKPHQPQSTVLKILQAWLAPLQLITKSLSVRAVRLSLFVAAGALLSLVRRGGAKSTPAPQEVLYSDFLNLCSSGNVERVRFEQGSQRLIFDVLGVADDSPGGLASTATKTSTASTKSAVASTSSAVKKIPRQFYTRHLPDPNLITTLRYVLNSGGERGGVVNESLRSPSVFT